MFILIASAAAVYLASLLFMARAVRRAPEGFEDARGYHPGRIVVETDAERGAATAVLSNAR